MQFTYNDARYFIPYPYLDNLETVAPNRRPEATFLPDQILRAVEKNIKPAIEPYWRAYHADVAAGKISAFMQTVEKRQNRIVITEPPISWQQALVMTSETLYRVNPVLGERFDQAAKQGWITAKPAAAAGLTIGSCDQRTTQHPMPKGRPATIIFEYDGTVNDPVYLAHEAGHFAADAANYGSAGGKGTLTQCLTKEVQAFFLQHAFYDPDLHPARSAELVRAVAQQKRGETLAVLSWYEMEFQAMEKSRLVRGDDRLPVDGAGFKQLDRGYSLHNDVHGPGFLSAWACVRVTRKCRPARKSSFCLCFIQPLIGFRKQRVFHRLKFFLRR